jgi:hypothetical protein
MIETLIDTLLIVGGIAIGLLLALAADSWHKRKAWRDADRQARRMTGRDR